MEYKTVIEIINEADSSTEAADIAGEYLRGSIDAGVRMKCITKPLRIFLAQRLVLFVLVIIAFIGITYFNINKSNPGITAPTRNISAIQPPLKTHILDKDFMDEWEKEKR